jgi:hypothetical protein
LRKHIEALSPLIMPAELLDIVFFTHGTSTIHLPVKRKRSEEQDGKEIVALLVIALGASCLSGFDKARQQYLDRADGSMESLVDCKESLHYVRAHILMALYVELFGSLR